MTFADSYWEENGAALGQIAAQGGAPNCEWLRGYNYLTAYPKVLKELATYAFQRCLLGALSGQVNFPQDYDHVPDVLDFGEYTRNEARTLFQRAFIAAYIAESRKPRVKDEIDG